MEKEEKRLLENLRYEEAYIVCQQQRLDSISRRFYVNDFVKQKTIKDAILNLERVRAIILQLKGR